MLQLLSSPEALASCLVEAAEWCTKFDLCTPAVDSRLGQWPLWRSLMAFEDKLDLAIVAADGLRSEPSALEHLQRRGVLRFVPAADGSFVPHVLRFTRGDDVRIVVASGALVPSGLMAPLAAASHWQGGSLEGYAAEVDRVFAKARALAHVAAPAELEEYAAIYFEAAAHRDAIAALGAPMMRRVAFDADALDLELVTEAREIRDAMAAMKASLDAVGPTRTRSVVGYHGASSSSTVSWAPALGIWWHFQKLDNRYWNAFGVQRPGSVASLQIAVEVNPPLAGVDRKMGGAVARDRSSNKLYLVHRGRIGGGQKGIGADLFWSRFRGGVRLHEPGRDEPTRVVLVGELRSTAFPRDLAAFVHEVVRIKRLV